MLFDHSLELIYPNTTGIDTITVGGTQFPGGMNIPSGTTATRTAAPLAGATRWNTSLGVVETWNGTAWFSHIPITSQAAGTVLAAPAGAAGLPTFRLQSLDEHSDVVITSPTTNQTLAYNGTNWVNTSVTNSSATGTVGVSPTGGGTAWTLVSGSRYTANFVHNLGTSNVVITVYDTDTNQIVIPDSVTVISNITVTIVVVGNTKTLKVVVVANGNSIVAGGSTPSSIITSVAGVTINASTTRLNFVGSTQAVDAGSGTTTVSIGTRFTYFANSLDTPNNSDWAVNSFAAAITDPTYPAMTVRSFSNTVEQGVGLMAAIPVGVTTLSLKFKGRATTAPGAASVVQPRLYYRIIPNNSAPGSWVGPIEAANIPIPTNAFFQYNQQGFTLSALGLSPDTLVQFEITRRVAGVTGTNLPSAFLLSELTIGFV